MTDFRFSLNKPPRPKPAAVRSQRVEVETTFASEEAEVHLDPDQRTDSQLLRVFSDFIAAAGPLRPDEKMTDQEVREDYRKLALALTALLPLVTVQKDTLNQYVKDGSLNDAMDALMHHALEALASLHNPRLLGYRSMSLQTGDQPPEKGDPS